MANQHHLKRYETFIANRLGRKLTGPVEMHHIQPRCVGGVDDAYNLIALTPREHFVAHWMLALAYPDVNGLLTAFAFMADSRGFKRVIRYSRAYHKAKLLLVERIVAANKKLVTAVNTATGERSRVTREEFESNPDLRGVQLGMTVARRLSTGVNEYVTKHQLQEDPDLVHFNVGKRAGAKSRMFRGYYITPIGRFESTTQAYQAHGLKSPMPIENRCRKLNQKVIGGRMLNCATDLTREEKELHYGKTWAEMGWGYEAVTS